MQIPNTPNSSGDRPSVVIVFQSSMTLVVGLIMLIIGVALGFLSYPGLFNRPVAVAPTPTALIASPASTQLLATPQPTATLAEVSVAPTVAGMGDATAQSADAQIAAAIARTRHFIGDPNATVTIVEFADFQCPYCGRFASGAGRQIDLLYIQTGKVRLGYQHFAFLGQESFWAAEASECANDQEAFWPYHDLLFASQNGENQGAFSKDNLKKLAASLNLDTTAFNTCLDSGKYTELVQSESNAARVLGVRSTPTFLVNGQPLIGAQPFEVFQQYIEGLLGATK
jgi:protein-disulfide isomerase